LIVTYAFELQVLGLYGIERDREMIINKEKGEFGRKGL
jgi:hypothetical protein